MSIDHTKFRQKHAQIITIILCSDGSVITAAYVVSTTFYIQDLFPLRTCAQYFLRRAFGCGRVGGSALQSLDFTVTSIATIFTTFCHIFRISVFSTVPQLDAFHLTDHTKPTDAKLRPGTDLGGVKGGQLSRNFGAEEVIRKQTIELCLRLFQI